MQFAFGAGQLYARRTDNETTTSANTMVQFGGLQEGTVEFSATSKEAKGQYQFPLAVARGTGKITCKSKMVSINGRLMNDLFFGSSSTPTTGTQIVTAQDAYTAIPSTPFTLPTLNAALTGFNLMDDLGVVVGPLLSDGTANTNTGAFAPGRQLTRVASGTPTTGQYVFTPGVVSTGKYLFASADNVSKYMVQLNYTYSYTLVGSANFSIANPLLGVNPVFSAILNVGYTGASGQQSLLFKLNACVAEKLGYASKLEDFMIPEFDFQAFADSSNNLCTISMTSY